jgi:excisionase family DNA binding protein
MPKPLITAPEELPAILTMAHVGSLFGLSRLKTYELARRKGFPVVRFGRVMRVPKAALLRWLDEQTGAEGQ